MLSAEGLELIYSAQCYNDMAFISGDCGCSVRNYGGRQIGSQA